MANRLAEVVESFPQPPCFIVELCPHAIRQDSACHIKTAHRPKPLDKSTPQVAHGETVRETSAMIAFLSEIVGIRDDMFLGEGHQ